MKNKRQELYEELHDIVRGERVRDEIEEEMNFLLENEIGRRFLRRLWGETGVLRSDYVPGQSDERLPFFEGQRNVGLMLFNRARLVNKQNFFKALTGGDEWMG